MTKVFFAKNPLALSARMILTKSGLRAGSIGI